MRICGVGIPFFVLLALLGGGLPARAQVTFPPGGLTVIRPTENGYADLAAACAALVAADPTANSLPDAAPVPSTALDRSQNAGATLADKRAALRDPRVRNALALLRDALSRPHIEPPAAGGTGPFLAMARLRELARILAIEEYVQLADGSTASAVDTFGETLALADVPQHWSLIGVMVGQTMTTIDVRTVATHLDRLSAGDCSRLLSLLKTELDAPNPAIVGIHADTAVATHVMNVFFDNMVGPPNANTDAADAAEVASAADSDGLTVAELRTIRSLHAENGDGWKAFQGNIAHQVEEQNDALAAQLEEYPRLPSTPSEEAQPGTEIDRIAMKFARALSLGDGYRAKILDSSVASRAQLQLLAVHAAIHRYRWEHNALPESLAVLKLGPLTNDPFVGGTMGYERDKDGKSYTLSCAGPPSRNDDGKLVTGGKRELLRLP